jgi:poly(beta-D-mannuronate) lyase
MFQTGVGMKVYLLGSLIFSFHNVAAAEDSSHAIHEALAAAGLPNPLRLELQRPVDPRLHAIESKGIDGCGLSKGKVHTAHTPSQVRALSGMLAPGDQLVLAGEDWKDTRFSFGGEGTPDSPILIRPEKPGSVIFTGATEIAIHGSNIILSGFVFRGVRLTKTNSVILRIGEGETKPANHCIVHNVTMENCGSESAEDWPHVRAWLLNIRGSDNTIADSTFTGFNNIGQMIGAAELPKEQPQRLHVLGNTFRNRPKIDDQNGYEILQIGWSGEKAKSAGALIEGNKFESCDGENEIISLKASDIVVRHNVFAGCQGVLSLRAANRVLVQDNTFDGKNKPNTGGITAEGSDHIIIGNTFKNLKTPRSHYFWPLAFLAGSAENYGENGDVAGYGRAKNILVAKNHFEHCDARIAIGAYPRKEYPLLPRNIRVIGNVFKGAKAANPFDYVAPDPEGELSKSLHESGNEFVE